MGSISQLPTNYAVEKKSQQSRDLNQSSGWEEWTLSRLYAAPQVGRHMLLTWDRGSLVPANAELNQVNNFFLKKSLPVQQSIGAPLSPDHSFKLDYFWYSQSGPSETNEYPETWTTSEKQAFSEAK